MGAFSLGSTGTSTAANGQEMSCDDSNEAGQDGLVQSPVKLTRTASASSGFAAGAPSDLNRKDIEAMIREWVEGHGSENIPSQMADLARRAHVDIDRFFSPQRRGQREKKPPATPTAEHGARAGILTGLRFVLTGVWPYQGSGQGLTLGKERVKSRIEKFGGNVTMSFSGLTDALVIGESPGPKKIIEAHNRSLKIITLVQLNALILGDLTLEELTSADYPDSAYAVLDAEKIQVQRHPHSSVTQEQAQDGPAGISPSGQVDDAAAAGDGHTDG